MSRRPFAVRVVSALIALSFALSYAERVCAQGDVSHAVQGVRLDSGALDNPGKAPAVVFSQTVDIKGAPWLRLLFDSATLPEGSWVAVTSLEDGEMMPLTAQTMREWQFTTAYFNGSRVQVDLIAGPRTAGNRITMSRVFAGSVVKFEPGNPDPSTVVCAAADNRAASNNAATGRLLMVNLPVPQCPFGVPCGAVAQAAHCTGWITNRAILGWTENRVLLSAGHCFNPGIDDQTRMTVIQFEPIPGTLSATCQLRHPPVRKQFAIAQNRVLFNFAAVGCNNNDWAAFVCNANPATGLTVFQEQNAEIVLAAAAPAMGDPVRKWGYGADGPAPTFCRCIPGDPASADNGVQQTDTGTVLAASVANVFRHNAHTCGGDSGAPVINTMTNEAVGIHIGGVCMGVVPRNCAIDITHMPVQNALTQLGNNNEYIPTNDNCASPIVISDGTYAFSTAGATPDGPTHMAPCGFLTNNFTTNDVWFTYTATGTGMTTISLCGSQYDTTLAVYTGGCPAMPANLVMNGCNDDSCGRSSQVTIMTTTGTVYRIRVAGFDGASGDGVILILPPNGGVAIGDACANYSLACEGPNAFASIGATTDGPVGPGGCAAGQDVWFAYLAPAAGTVTAHTCIGTDFDTVIAAYNVNAAYVVPVGLRFCPAPLPAEMLPNPFIQALCPPAAQLACNDDSCGLRSLITFPVAANTVYLIRVGGFNTGTGRGNLTIIGPTGGAAPPNDTCMNAFPVIDGLNAVDNRNATDGMANGCGSGAADVFYQYIATRTGQTTAETCGLATWDTVLAVYSDCASATPIACNDDGCDSVRSRVTWNALAGTSYIIRLHGFGGATGTGQLRIIPPSDTPVNDNCADAVTVFDGQTFFDISGATENGPFDCVRSIFQDIWYRYTATSIATRFSTCGSTYDSAIAVYSSTDCPPMNFIACNDNSDVCGAGSQQALLDLPTTIGQTYLIRVGATGFPRNQGVLTIGAVPAPANNLCNTATVVMDGLNPISNLGATDAAGLGCGSGRAAVYYSYTATANGSAFAETCGLATWDTALGVYANCADGAVLACNDDDCKPAGLQSRVTWDVTIGSTYIIRLHGFNGALGTGQMRIGVQVCGCEWNKDGMLTSQDFFDFLDDFLADNADFNNDGFTTSEDFFDFVNCFFTGCP